MSVQVVGTSASWNESRQAFSDASQWFLSTAGRVGDRWDDPGLGEWSIRALVGHTTRAFLTIETYLARPAESVRVRHAAEYFQVARAVASTAEIAARGHVAGEALGPDPLSSVAEIARRVLLLVGQSDPRAVVSTPAGGMHLVDYLPTRTFELAVHTCDLSRALRTPLDIPASTAGQALRIVSDLALAAGSAGPLLLASTGRAGLPEGFTVLGL